MKQEENHQVSHFIQKNCIKDNPLTFIESLSLESGENILYINLKIKGLWKNNYSLTLHNNRLMIAVLLRLKNKKNQFITYSTSLLLPKNVYRKKNWSNFFNDELHIKIAKQIHFQPDEKQQIYEKIKLKNWNDRLGIVFKN